MNTLVQCTVTVDSMCEVLKADMSAMLSRTAMGEDEVLAALHEIYRHHMFVCGMFTFESPFVDIRALCFDGEICGEKRTLTVYQ